MPLSSCRSSVSKATCFYSRYRGANLFGDCSAWWGNSFVSELTRISETALKKVILRRLSAAHDNEGKPTIQDGHMRMEKVNGEQANVSQPKPSLGSRSYTAA